MNERSNVIDLIMKASEFIADGKIDKRWRGQLMRIAKMEENCLLAGGAMPTHIDIDYDVEYPL